MKAIALTRYLPIDHPEALLDVDLPMPQPGPHDLMVKIHAVAVNPVDCKVRAPKDKSESSPRVLGWDGAGEVVAVGSAVRLFTPGDRVYYAGDITRPGCNSEYHLVDERIAGPMPQRLSFEEAAALPLTTITAWEALFDRLQVPRATPPQPGASLLVVGGAGGVGSIAIQLATKVAGMTVIATASRRESQGWVREMGAQWVVDHQQPLPAQLAAIGHPTVDYVLILHDIDRHFPAVAELIAPQGRICTIVENSQPLPVERLKMKSAAFMQEFMFTRSMFQTTDMIEQHRLLAEVARMIDAGTLRSTLGKVLRPIDATNLKAAHAALESGRSIGKIVLSGF